MSCSILVRCVNCWTTRSGTTHCVRSDPADDVSASLAWESKDGFGMSAATMTKRCCLICWSVRVGEGDERDEEDGFDLEKERDA